MLRMHETCLGMGVKHRELTQLTRQAPHTTQLEHVGTKDEQSPATCGVPEPTIQAAQRIISHKNSCFVQNWGCLQLTKSQPPPKPNRSQLSQVEPCFRYRQLRASFLGDTKRYPPKFVGRFYGSHPNGLTWFDQGVPLRKIMAENHGPLDLWWHHVEVLVGGKITCKYLDMGPNRETEFTSKPRPWGKSL